VREEQMPPTGYTTKKYEGVPLYVCDPPCPYDTFEEDRMANHQAVIHGTAPPPEDTPASMRVDRTAPSPAQEETPKAEPAAPAKAAEATTHDDAGTGSPRPRPPRGKDRT
jgi:hypothetical protein